jgi:hypothetical protein
LAMVLKQTKQTHASATRELNTMSENYGLT